MSLNKYMHKRNPFKNKKIDFKLFCEKYTFFKELFTNTDNVDEVNIDFKSPSHIAAISKALLLDTMNLDVYLPLDRLIPTIPLRMNYILWIEDLLSNAPIAKDGQINIFDIGCGASCIYALLGASKNQWFFKASEIDEFNAKVATDNVSRNNLTDKIEILQVSAATDGGILRHAFATGRAVSFIHCVMCNPPFYASTLDKSALLTTRNPSARDAAKSINTAVRHESLTEGGETNFAARLIDESFEYRDSIGIFTIMLGKKSSSETVKKYLLSKSVSNYSIFEFCQGRVMRWGVAWSFLPAFQHPKSEFHLSKDLNRPPLLWNIPPILGGIAEYSVGGVYEALKIVCKNLEIEVLEQKNRQSQGGGFHLLLTAQRNTWSHQRRKRREIQRLAKATNGNQPEIESSEEPEAKRRKIDLICAEADALDCGQSESHSSEVSCEECVLKCTFNVTIIMDNNFPALQLQARYIDGQREAMNEVMTFVKNFLKKTP